MKKAIGLAALASLSLSGPAHSVGPYVPIGDRVAAAELIVAGEVIGLQGVMGPETIHTDVALRLAHTLKGRLSESEVTFRSLGGQVGDLVSEPEESVRYRLRDRLIVLLARHQSRWVPLSSAENSVVYMGANIPANRVDWERAVNRVSVLVSGRTLLPETASGQSVDAPTITSVRPRGAAGMDSHGFVQIRGSGFGTPEAGQSGLIRFRKNHRDSDISEKWREYKYADESDRFNVWTDTFIEFRPRHGPISSGPVQVSRDGTSWSAVSQDSLNVKYNRTNGRWPFATAREGIRYSIDATHFDAWGSSLDTSAVRGAIQDAFAAWESVSDVDLSFAFEGYSTHGWNGNDRYNAISWYSGPAIPDKVSARADPVALSGILRSADVIFNADDTWAISGTDKTLKLARIRKLMIHEIGHMLGFLDLGGAEDVRSKRIMSKWAPSSFDYSGPDSDTIEGLRRIYGKWSGTLSPELNKTVWLDTIRISGDVTVPSADTLIIESNTVVLADSMARLLVQGQLDASAGGITLRAANSTDPSKAWYGVQVKRGGTATLTGATVRDGTHCAKADSGGTLTSTNVTLTNCGTPPVISGPGAATFAEHGTGAVATYTATDAEQDPVTWSLVDSGDDDDFTLDRRLGVLRFRSPPDYEAPTDSGHVSDPDTNNVYHITVRATDGQQASADSSVTVTVTDAAEPVASFSASGYRALEGGLPVDAARGAGLRDTVTVRLRPAPARRARIPVTVTPVTAESGDYEVGGLDSSALVFAAQSDSQSFTIAARADADVADETIGLGFGPLPPGVVAGVPSTATVTIHDTPNRPSGLTATRGLGQVRLAWEAAGDDSIRGWQYRTRVGPAAWGAGRRWTAAGRRRPRIRWTACASGPSTGSGCGPTRAGMVRPRIRRARRRRRCWPRPSGARRCFDGWTRRRPKCPGRSTSPRGSTG